MDRKELKVLAVSGTLGEGAAVRVGLLYLVEQLVNQGVTVDQIDLSTEQIPLFNPKTSYRSAYYPALVELVTAADVLVLATPDYHGGMSGVLKNFLDHFWKEYAGKLLVPMVCSNDKGLTVADQIRTLARQTYAWCLPYAVTFADRVDVKDDVVVSESLQKRLQMTAGDIATYGPLLARQRSVDLASTSPGFMAAYRSQSKPA